MKQTILQDQILKRPQVVSYLLSGRLLHLITLIEILAIIFLVPIILKMDTGNSYILFYLKYYAVFFLLSLPLFSQLDARSRYQNYKQIKDQFYTYGFDRRILNPVLKSRCQRDAAVIAAEELGLKKPCNQYFRHFGYRWYHLFPDFVFQKPQFLLTRYFWQTTFFASTYEPKVDFKILSDTEIKSRFVLGITNEPY